STSLFYSGIFGFLASMVFALKRKIPNKVVLRGLWSGIKSMLPAIYILVFAWAITDVIDELGTGDYLAGLVNEHISLTLIPMLLFLIAAFMSFATGTSWGTFGIMLPIAAQIAASIDPALMLPVLGAVLSG